MSLCNLYDLEYKDTVFLNGEIEKNNEFEASEDEIVLQKVEGKWKVVYANLRFDDNMSYYYNGMERTVEY